MISRAENQGISEKWFSPCQFVSTLSQENIRVQIWKASKRYYGILCSGNNKFGGLKIFESLFPNGIYRDFYYEPQAVNREGRVAPVQEIFQEHVQEHLVLMGEGGIGKTTFLEHQLSVLLKEKEQMPDMIPVYVELNRCPNVIGQWYSSKITLIQISHGLKPIRNCWTVCGFPCFCVCLRAETRQKKSSR